MLEWNLPPKRFRRMGTTSFYITWARMSFFSTVLVSDIDNAALRRTVGNRGAQIDFRVIALSHLKFTVSLGYAAAFEKDHNSSREFMLSLKLN